MSSLSLLPSSLMITIDGPAASGKGTMAQLLAKKLNGVHLDSGLFYRTYAYIINLMLSSMSDLDQEQFHKIEKLLTEQLIFSLSQSGLEIIYKDQHLEHKILKSEKIGQLASQMAQYPAIRASINKRILQLASTLPVLVADGRDMSTEVFPTADYSFYLEASVEIRAQRRFKELKSRDLATSYEEVLAEMKKRDQRDSERRYGALKIAPHAQIINSDHLSQEEVLEKMLNIILTKAQ